MALSDRKQRFVEAYLADENPERAAEAAGYSADRGRELLESEEVQAALRTAGELKNAWRIATPGEILELWTKIIRRDDEVCDFEVVRTKTRREYFDPQGKKVVEDAEGQEILKIPPSLKDVMKAAEEVIDRWDKFMAPDPGKECGVVEIPAVLPEEKDGEGGGGGGGGGGGEGGETSF